MTSMVLAIATADLLDSVEHLIFYENVLYSGHTNGVVLLLSSDEDRFQFQGLHEDSG